MKKVLLIAYKFPPYVGVGSNRWSCLCKYLVRLGHEMHVVTISWNKYVSNALLPVVNAFLEKTTHPGITAHRIPSGYPNNLKYKLFHSSALNLINKFIYKILYHIFLKRRYYDDEAQGWGKYLIPYCEELIKREKIEVVIATGHPFQTNRWAAELKKRNPSIKLIQDFRDPWSMDPDRKYPATRLSQVEAWQREAVEIADCVVAITQGLLNLYLKNTSQCKGVVIENGVDPEDIPQEKIEISDNKHIVLTYLGNLTNGRDRIMDSLLNCIHSHYEELSFLKVVIIGASNYKLDKGLSSLLRSGNLEIMPIMPRKEAFAELQKADYALQINAKQHPCLVSTKIYEYGALKVPTVSLNYGGEIEALVKKYQLGYSINLIRDDLYNELLNLRNSSTKFAMDSTSFLYQNKAVEYSKIIESLP